MKYIKLYENFGFEDDSDYIEDKGIGIETHLDQISSIEELGKILSKDIIDELANIFGSKENPKFRISSIPMSGFSSHLDKDKSDYREFMIRYQMSGMPIVKGIGAWSPLEMVIMKKTYQKLRKMFKQELVGHEVSRVRKVITWYIKYVYDVDLRKITQYFI